MNRICEICQQGPITSESQWQQHISGKKHKKNEWKKGSGMQYDLPDDKRSSYFVANTNNVETIEVKLCLDDDLEDQLKHEPSYAPQSSKNYQYNGDNEFPQLGGHKQSSYNNPGDSFPALPSVNQLSTKMSGIGLGRGIGRGATAASSPSSGPAWSWSNVTKQSAPAPAPVQTPIPQNIPVAEPRQLTQSERSGNVRVIQQVVPTAPTSSETIRPMAKSAKHEMAKRIYREYKANHKTASQAFQEIATNLQWNIQYEECNPDSKSLYNYAARWTVNGFACEAGEGSKKKAAKENASRKALSKFANVIEKPEKHSIEQEREESVVTTTPSTVYNPANDYKQLTMRRIEVLVRTVTKIELGNPTKFAAFIITRQSNQPAAEGEVVAIGTGRQVTKFSHANLKEAYGYRLHDMQAPVMAKRAFQAYLYGQLSQVIQSDGMGSRKYGENIFEYNRSGGGHYRLKSGIRVHLFVSHTPSGDATAFIRDDWTEPEYLSEKDVQRDLQGQLSPTGVDVEKGYGRLRVVEDAQRDETNYLKGTSNGMNGKVTIMSLSDKVMKWNHLGVQGALLTHFIEPIFLHSIQVGCKYLHQHAARAFLTRVPISIFPTLPNCYNNAVDPFIGRTTKMLMLRNRPEGSVAWDWFTGANNVEVIDCTEGLVDLRNPIYDAECSRLSRVTMLQRFGKRLSSVYATGDVASTEMIKRLRHSMKGDFNRSTYRDLKLMATDYQDAKEKLYSTLSKNLMGNWKSKDDLQKFSLDDYA